MFDARIVREEVFFDASLSEMKRRNVFAEVDSFCVRRQKIEGVLQDKSFFEERQVKLK